MFVQNYITIFDDLSHRSGVREHYSQTIARFVRSLRSKIRHAIIIGSYDLDTVEEAFNVALKMHLIFKTLVNAKA